MSKWITSPWKVLPKAGKLNEPSSSSSSSSSSSNNNNNNKQSKVNNNNKSEIWNEVTKQRSPSITENNNSILVPNNPIEDALKIPYKINVSPPNTTKKTSLYSSASQMNSTPPSSSTSSSTPSLTTSSSSITPTSEISKVKSKNSQTPNVKLSNAYSDGSVLNLKRKTAPSMKLNKNSNGILQPHQLSKVSLSEQLNSMSKIVNSDDDGDNNDIDNIDDHAYDSDSSDPSNNKDYKKESVIQKQKSLVKEEKNSKSLKPSKSISSPPQQQQQQQQQYKLTKDVDLSQNSKYLEYQDNNNQNDSDTDIDDDNNTNNNELETRYYSDDESQMLRSLPPRTTYLNAELSNDFETELEDNEQNQALTEGILLTKNTPLKPSQYGGNPFISTQNENRSRKIRSRSPFEIPQTIKVSDESEVLQTPETKRTNQVSKSITKSKIPSPSSISESRSGVDDDSKEKVVKNEKLLPPPPPPPPIPSPFPPVQTKSYESYQSSNLEFDSDLLIDRNEITLIQKIGEGFFGEVWKGKWNQTQDIAIKKMKHEVTNANDRNTFLSEVFSLSKLRHPNITIFYGVTSPPDALIISELLNGSLFQLIHGYKNDPVPINSPLPLLVILRILRDVASGGSYLHKRKPPIIHRDLSSSNVLLSVSSKTSNEELLQRCGDETRPIAKLTDFGLSRNVDWYMTSCVGNLFYLAPEVFSGDHYTQSADVYSFGILIWELVARVSPYASESPQRAAFLAATKGFRPSHGHQDTRTPSSLINLREKCWDANPLERPSFPDVLSQLNEMFESIKNHDDILTNPSISSSLYSSSSSDPSSSSSSTSSTSIVTNEFNSNTSAEYMDQFSIAPNETTNQIWNRRIRSFERAFLRRPLVFELYKKGILRSLPDPSLINDSNNIDNNNNIDDNHNSTSNSNTTKESGSSLKSQKKSGTHPQNIAKQRLVARNSK